MNNGNDNTFPMHIGIMVMSAAQLASVYALLGGASPGAIAASGSGAGNDGQSKPAEPAVPQAQAGEQQQQQQGGDAGSGAAVELDAHGHPWSAELHASTKGKTKDGLWRMKVGVARPAPAPGFPKDAAAPGGTTGTSNGGAASGPGASATGQGAGPATANEGEDEDEFAAFRAAAEKAGATDAAAAAAAPARTWTDADLGALCNQAAVKLGDPATIKAIIASFVPEGTVPHSRNIPAERREEFAQTVEKAAGITFAG
jgi:hypothetical protein